MTKEEEIQIKKKFIKEAIVSILTLVKANRDNFDIEKSYVGGYSIGVWQKTPFEDIGSFCGYKSEEDRDHDFDLFMKLLEE
jgi:hypothetical protein